MSAANNPLAGNDNVGPTQVNATRELAGLDGGDTGYNYLMSNDEQRAEFIANDSTLRYDEWKTISDAVIRNRKQALSLVNDLRSRGLTKNLSLATYVDLWHTVSDFDDAETVMNPGDTTSEDDVGFALDGAPLPVTHKSWRIDRRLLMASRQNGTDLDTLVPSLMTRSVARQVERLAFEGWSPTIDGYTMYGLLNHPSRNTATAPGSWSDDTNDAANIRDTLYDLVEALENDEFGGGDYLLYLHRNEYQRIRRVVDDIGDGSQNMLARINEEFDAELGGIRQAPHVPAGEAVMFQPSDDVIQVGVAEDIQPVEWESPGGWTVHMKVFGAMNTEIKATENGQCGIVHATGL